MDVCSCSQSFGFVYIFFQEKTHSLNGVFTLSKAHFGPQPNVFSLELARPTSVLTSTSQLWTQLRGLFKKKNSNDKEMK